MTQLEAEELRQEILEDDRRETLRELAFSRNLHEDPDTIMECEEWKDAYTALVRLKTFCTTYDICFEDEVDALKDLV